VELYLEGNGLVLRSPRPSDAAAMAEAVRESQPLIGRYLVWAIADYGVTDAAQWCRVGDPTDGTRPLHVFDHKGTLLGGVGLHAPDLRNGKVELGYWTRSAARGTGVAERASRLVVDHAFTHLGVCRVELIIAVGNVASHRVADKLGARLEGLLRDRLRLRDGLSDAHLYALLARDFRR